MNDPRDEYVPQPGDTPNYDERDDLYPDVDHLVDLGYMQDFGLGYPEWT